MDHDRRTFLKTTGLAGAAAVAGTATLPVATPSLAQNAAGASEPKELRITVPTQIKEIRVPFEFTDLPLPH